MFSAFILRHVYGGSSVSHISIYLGIYLGIYLQVSQNVVVPGSLSLIRMTFRLDYFFRISESYHTQMYNCNDSFATFFNIELVTQ